MKKQKTKQSKIPRNYLVIGIASIALNILTIVMIGVAYYVNQSGLLDYAVINTGLERMCSDDFRAFLVESQKGNNASENDNKRILATVDYPCSKNGAENFYSKGFNDYTKSLGITN